jgi:aarF domain-containing kinase
VTDSHASKTRISNASVAIKVVHPRVDKIIRRDLAIMRIFAKALNALPGMHWLSLPEEVDVFGDMMNQQLDLRVEANNLDRFEKNFAHRGPSVTFPRPIRLGDDKETEDDGPAGSRVLIEEFQDALPLKWFLRNGGGPFDDRIANIGLDAFLVSRGLSPEDLRRWFDMCTNMICQNMLLIDNWTHGDLHP